MTEPQAQRRPVWLAVMSSAMLVYAGMSLVDALSLLRTPQAVTAAAIEDIARGTGQIDAARALASVSEQIVSAHPLAVRADAAVSGLVALLTLFAVAAIFARDRRARHATIAAGWAGIAYQLAALPFGVAMARRAADAGAPVLMQVLIQNGKQVSGLADGDVGMALRAAVTMMPVLRASMGVAWSLALLIFFGGRRGRAAFGVGNDAPAP
ncbi:MAG TPA: hypothetical protein VMT03_19515 [Polyangia bacterium]|nr:hypothetical protein [Polyangia bacterium]